MIRKFTLILAAAFVAIGTMGVTQEAKALNLETFIDWLPVGDGDRDDEVSSVIVTIYRFHDEVWPTPDWYEFIDVIPADYVGGSTWVAEYDNVSWPLAWTTQVNPDWETVFDFEEDNPQWILQGQGQLATFTEE